MRHAVGLIAVLIVAGLGIHSCVAEGIFVPGTASAYLLIMALPGAATYLLLERNPRAIELVLSALVVSPIVVTIAAVLMMMCGLLPRDAAILIAITSGIIASVCLFKRDRFPMRWEMSVRQALILSSFIIAVCTLIGYLPFSEEWWRIRSDAWFHGAVVAQINSYGIPPEDPYFLGMPLQYMWFYHVLVLLISKATNIETFKVMQLLNIHAMFGFILATLAFSSIFKNRFGHGMSSVITVLLGMNAAFWLFLPLKLVRAFTGEVRGFDQLAQMLSLSPLDMERALHFVSVYHSRQFLMDKFVVGTAFSLGLCFMAAFWFATTLYFSERRRVPLVLAFSASVGMIGFHTVAGGIMLAGLVGGLVLLHLSRHRVESYDAKRLLTLLLTGILALIALSPYIYSVTHLKESQQAFPFILSFRKVAGILISCALVTFLSAFQVKRLLRWRTPQARYFVFATISVVLICLVIRLPGPNTLDKPPFFVFYPLAVVGGWTLAELPFGGMSALGRRITVCLVFLAMFLPLNLVMMLGYFSTQPKEVLDPWEMKIASWVKTHTARNAVFFDSDDRVFLLVAGPRRYYYGCETYAYQWGYNSTEMARRKDVRDNLYSEDEPDQITIDSLAGIVPDVYIIVREDEEGTGGLDKFARHHDLFHNVYSAGPMHVFAIDKAALR